MAFGLEVIILVEVDLPTIRTEAYDDNKNSEVLGQDLGPNWEGLYKITKLADKGAYHLEDLEGKQVPRSWIWNSKNLRKYYQ